VSHDYRRSMPDKLRSRLTCRKNAAVGLAHPIEQRALPCSRAIDRVPRVECGFVLWVSREDGEAQDDRNADQFRRAIAVRGQCGIARISEAISCPSARRARVIAATIGS